MNSDFKLIKKVPYHLNKEYITEKKEYMHTFNFIISFS